jgi:hypothetical protein
MNELERAPSEPPVSDIDPLARELGLPDDAFVFSFIQSMPVAYRRAFDEDAQHEHAAIVFRRGARAAHVEIWRKLPDRIVAIVLAADDRPGLLSRVSAALVAHDLDVIAAQAFCRERGDGAVEATARSRPYARATSRASARRSRRSSTDRRPSTARSALRTPDAPRTPRRASGSSGTGATTRRSFSSKRSTTPGCYSSSRARSSTSGCRSSLRTSRRGRVTSSTASTSRSSTAPRSRRRGSSRSRRRCSPRSARPESGPRLGLHRPNRRS